MPKTQRFELLLAALTWLAAPVAHAHISLDQGTTQKSRYGDGEIKQGPCGRAGGQRGTNIYTYAPGETITVDVVEFITHPGYFRIAFDADGDDAFVDPASIPNMPPSGRACSGDAQDHCGQADFNNNSAVLMDNLDPHATAASGKPHHTWQVQLPDVECDNCTLQIIQMMTDKPPYVPNTNDIYYQCIDLVLRAGGATDGPGGAGVGGSAGAVATTGGSASSPTASAGAGAAQPATHSSGCSVAPDRAPGAIAGLWPVAAVMVARWRRRRRAQGPSRASGPPMRDAAS